jgi:chaperonin GroEL (HSP60 family)
MSFTPAILFCALEEPLRQLAENTGLEGSVVVNDVRKAYAAVSLDSRPLSGLIVPTPTD